MNDTTTNQIPVPGMTRQVWDGFNPELQAMLQSSLDPEVKATLAKNAARDAAQYAEDKAKRDAMTPEEGAAKAMVDDVLRYHREAMGHLALMYGRIVGLADAGKLDRAEAIVLLDNLNDVSDDLYGGILRSVLDEDEWIAVDHTLPGEA